MMRSTVESIFSMVRNMANGYPGKNFVAAIKELKEQLFLLDIMADKMEWPVWNLDLKSTSDSKLEPNLSIFYGYRNKFYSVMGSQRSAEQFYFSILLADLYHRLLPILEADLEEPKFEEALCFVLKRELLFDFPKLLDGITRLCRKEEKVQILRLRVKKEIEAKLAAY